jgi:hypothetical protein
MPKPNKIISWDLVVRWSDDPLITEVLYEVPDHIVRDLEYYFDTLEEERNDIGENDELETIDE